VGGSGPQQVTGTNRFLSLVMQRIRAAAPPRLAGLVSAVRIDRAGGGSFAQVWFLTRGCSWDRGGACTMCNYGRAYSVTEEAMVQSVESALESIVEPVDELFVSPSGSMLDPAEVSPAARRAIFRRMASFRAPKVCIETRAETVTPATVEEVASTFAAKSVAVEIGVESSSPWILRFCINKATNPARFVASGRMNRIALRTSRPTTTAGRTPVRSPTQIGRAHV